MLAHGSNKTSTGLNPTGIWILRWAAMTEAEAAFIGARAGEEFLELS